MINQVVAGREKYYFVGSSSGGEHRWFE